MVTGGEGYQIPTLWQADGGKRVRTLGRLQSNGAPYYGDVTGLAISGDGKRVLAGTYWEATLWDAASGKGVHTLKGHGGEVEDVTFSPDSKQLASASSALETKDKKTTTETGETVKASVPIANGGAA